MLPCAAKAQNTVWNVGRGASSCSRNTSPLDHFRLLRSCLQHWMEWCLSSPLPLTAVSHRFWEWGCVHLRGSVILPARHNIQFIERKGKKKWAHNYYRSCNKRFLCPPTPRAERICEDFWIGQAFLVGSRMSEKWPIPRHANTMFEALKIKHIS